MADDFENLYDLDNLNDAELRDLVRQQLSEYPEIDPDLVDVQVVDGRVQLSGRVGTEQELQQIEHVITDVIGLSAVDNEMVVDELVRGEMPEAADDAAAYERSVDPQMGTGARRTEDSARHLQGDTSAELYGTHDPQQATEGGLAYVPPDRPIQQGTESRENH
ncbi:MAG: BON domain-containing protein [Gemmatimonadota bacterium]